MSSRFYVSPFKYNDRIAIALLPCLVILGSYAGRIVSGIMLVGAMLTYIMDTLRWREAAFASVWITLIACNVGFIISTTLLRNSSFMLLFGSFGVNGSALMMTGLWGTVQFKWILVQYTQLALPIERLLMACALPVAMIVGSWGLSGALGMDVVPFPSMAIGCALYALCMRPLPSSFQRNITGPRIGGVHTSMQRLQGRFEGAVSAAMICTFPAVLYCVGHLEVLFQSDHIWSVNLLWSLPALFLSVIPHGMWWVSDHSIVVQYFRSLVVVVAGIVCVFAFEGRVIFHSFGTYIPLHFPINWIVVSTFLGINAVLLAAHLAGALHSQIGFKIGSAMLILSACAGGAAFGMPIFMIPAPLFGSAAFSLFYDSRSLRDYFIFVIGTAASFCWILFHHFWFLEVSIGTLSIRSVCQLVAIAVVVALTVPGLMINENYDKTIQRGMEALLIVQAIVVTLLEEQLFAGEHDYDVVVYPAYFVLSTSIVGGWFAQTWITTVPGWLSDWLTGNCIYVSKLPMLLLPQARLVLPMLGLALSISPPFLLMKPTQQRLVPWKGTLLVLGIAFATILARMAIFDIVQALISSHPSEGLLLGILVLVASAGCIPLFYRFYSHSFVARRGMSLAVALAALLCFLRPPVPIKGMAKCPNLPAGLCPRLWDERHIPDREVDDLEMYGMGWTRREHWPLWLIIAAVMTGLVAVTSGTPSHKPLAPRLFWGTMGGVCSGCYLGLEFFPDQKILQICCIASCLTACCLLILVQQPSGLGLPWMPMVVVSWLALLAVSVILQAELPLPKVSEELTRFWPDQPRMAIRERESTGRAAILAIFAAQSLLGAFSMKLKISRVIRQAVRDPPAMSSRDRRKPPYENHLHSASPSFLAFCGPGGPSAMFSTMVSPQVFDRLAGMMKMSRAGEMMHRRLSNEGLAWMPTVGNVLTILSFLLCLWLNLYFTNGQDFGILVIMPILLLLNQDPFVFRDLVDRRRYFPVAAALVVCFWVSSLSTLFTDAFYDNEAKSLLLVCRNVAGLLASIPSIAQFLRFLWVHDQLGSSFHAIVLLPLNIIPLLLGDVTFIVDLGIMGLIGSVVLGIMYSRLRRIGQRLL